MSKNCKTDVAVLTISKGLDYTDLDNYVRTFAKEKGYAYDASSSEADYIVYVIDMKSRAVRVVTSGIAKSDISQSDLQSIIDKTTSTLSDGNYYKACVKYTDITQKLLSTSKTYKLFLYMPIKLLISFAWQKLFTIIWQKSDLRAIGFETEAILDLRTLLSCYGYYYRLNICKTQILNKLWPI